MMMRCLVSSVMMSYIGVIQGLMVSSEAQKAVAQRFVLWGLVTVRRSVCVLWLLRILHGVVFLDGARSLKKMHS